MSDVNGFAIIPNALLREKDMGPHMKIVYGVIMSYAWGRDGCYASVKRLCEETGIGRTTWFDATAKLEARGWIRIEKKKTAHGWSNVYWPVMRGGVAELLEGGSPPGERGVVREANGGSSASRSQKKTQGEEDPVPDGTGRAQEEEQLDLDGGSTTKPKGRPKLKPTTVDRIKVTTAEHAIAREILGVFNSIAKTNYSGVPALTKIIMRHREHPTLTVEDHRRLITHQFADPWWDGAAAPNVIYGNQDLFERVVNSTPKESKKQGESVMERKRRERKELGWG